MARKIRIAVVEGNNYDDDFFIFHSRRLVKEGKIVEFDVRRKLDYFDLKDFVRNGEEPKYSGILAHPGIYEQRGAIDKLQSIDGIKFALYSVNVKQFEGKDVSGTMVFDRDSIDAIVNYFSSD